MVSSPATIRSSVDLPQPEGPDQHAELAVADFEVDALDGLEAAGVGLADVAESYVSHGDYLWRVANSE